MTPRTALDKREGINQGQLVDNKQLGVMLKLAQDKMDELERVESGMN
ncbi:hypothetical protein OGY83_18105 [Citrobacter sp. Cpo090]|nr:MULTISPECIES: hypothetical protein [Citrobacter]MDM2845533.1 hypothetical protein [Citrobacter sp. Cpo090]MEB0967998.1 hypothetical protein [Citrobacter braakii]